MLLSGDGRLGVNFRHGAVVALPSGFALALAEQADLSVFGAIVRTVAGLVADRAHPSGEALARATDAFAVVAAVLGARLRDRAPFAGEPLVAFAHAIHAFPLLGTSTLVLAHAGADRLLFTVITAPSFAADAVSSDGVWIVAAAFAVSAATLRAGVGLAAVLSLPTKVADACTVSSSSLAIHDQ